MAEIPMVFILAGLAAYTVLAGADFGANARGGIAAGGIIDNEGLVGDVEHGAGV